MEKTKRKEQKAADTSSWSAIPSRGLNRKARRRMGLGAMGAESRPLKKAEIKKAFVAIRRSKEQQEAHKVTPESIIRG